MTRFDILKLIKLKKFYLFEVFLLRVKEARIHLAEVTNYDYQAR